MEVAIVGAGGYTGVELIKILLNHPYFEIGALFGTQPGELNQLYPGLEGVANLKIEEADIDKISQFPLVFLAVPHKTAMGYVIHLRKRGVKVVDFSADYRLKRENYEKFYCPHIDPTNLKKSAYGLPELFRKEIVGAELVANPGCYPTATLLGLFPFLPYIDQTQGVFVDAKSGVSGAGKKVTETTQFVNVDENFFPYNPIRHRHSIEIEEKSGVKVTFVPHLMPVNRGMEVSIYAQLKDEVEPLPILESFYADEPFVRVFPHPVSIKQVNGTHFCDIFAMTNGTHLYVNVVIDNLLRGASSQAVA
ncbi:MAG: N-acetyl-gamma-glutamyl-phosphate reductase, partial [Epsilonproteobacteria bacterium]|nr:N-acetyl-gamma-glutamyl-phosphate reductase [Campylobacterota bacterium]NPA89570.1 N-acetyl-gamma-glutamyl-phosphate reductase [Campylobacterota bacterium]